VANDGEIGPWAHDVGDADRHEIAVAGFGGYRGPGRKRTSRRPPEPMEQQRTALNLFTLPFQAPGATAMHETLHGSALAKVGGKTQWWSVLRLKEMRR
jgi:hypothetical protein